MRAALAAGFIVALAGPVRADDGTGVSDEEILAVADEGEVVEIWAERPDKPFDRDTVVRLTGEELARRGVTDLAEALEYIPELRVRAMGRGGLQVDIRGSRKAAVKILIDGIPVDEPYYGTFDLSSIPVTDIEQIRVSTSPSSPIDGAGGPGGLIEVHTRDAVGGWMARARAQASSLPDVDASATGRAPLSRRWAVRGSATGQLGMHDFDLTMPDGTAAAVDEDRRDAHGAARVEYRRGDRVRLVGDLSVQHRSFIAPPSEEGPMDILVVDGETGGRAGVSADVMAGAWKLHGRGYAHLIDRDAAYYTDPMLGTATRGESITADREGVAVLANRPTTSWLNLVVAATFDTEAADVRDLGGASVGGGRSSVGELAAGAQLHRGPVRVDVAAGVALPVGVGDAPWPEAKLVVTYTPVPEAQLKLIGARKGRLPTLRERYRTDIGNPELEPEIATFGELEVTLRPAGWLRWTAGAFVRDTDGMIRFDGDRAALMNVDALVVRGIDLRVTFAEDRAVHGGATWSFADARSSRLAGPPLDFLPAHRGELWLGGRLRAGYGGTVRLRYTGEQIDRNETLDDYATIDLSAFARITGHARGTLRIDNAADLRHPVRAGVTAPGRVVLLSVEGSWD